MDGMAQSAVDSLLGRLTTLLIDEAKLLGSVRGDVQFIKDEMESMHGFLLDADAGRSSHQVRAWRRQVREVAYDSQNCINRYVQTVGASRPSEGVLGSIARVLYLVQTIGSRHRIAAQIKDLKARAREVGERRQRYGVKAPMITEAGDREAKEGGGTKLMPPLQQEAEDARRRRAIADAADWVNTDAQQVMAWLKGRGAHGGHSGPWYKSVTKFSKNMWNAQSKTKELAPLLMTMIREILGDEQPENVTDAAGFLMNQNIDMMKGEMHMAVAFVKQMFGLDRGHPTAAGASGSSPPKQDDKKMKQAAASLPGDYGDKKKKPAAADPIKRLREGMAAADLTEMVKADALYYKQLTEWLARVLRDGIFREQLFQRQGGYPRLLAIVTPPVDADNLEDDERGAHKGASELARRVYDSAFEGGHFNCRAWVDAKPDSRKNKLQSILQQLREQHPSSRDDDGGENEMSSWDEERLNREIQDNLRGKKFLIVLADHEDDAPWTDIAPALQTDSSDESVIIVTPLIQHAIQFIGWYTASNLFVIKNSRHRVHFYSHLDVVRKIANELLQVGSDHVEDDLNEVVNEILKKCRWDSFSTKMVLHALYANPRRNKGELEKLLPGLNEFSTVSNARHMIRFCYDDLASHHKACLLYLSIYPSNTEITRTSLVRRWVAEGLVTKRDRLTATDEAECCFDKLIARGLLLPADNTGPSTGKIKKCKVDPHVLSFINRMPRDDCGNADIIDLPLALAHRLSIPSAGIQLPKNTLQASWFKKQQHRTGAAVWQDSTDGMVKLLRMFPTSQSGWIKVLDLEGYRGLKNKHLKNICNKIFQLKYLSLRNTGIAKLPKEINKLQYLETFDIRETEITSFPTKSIVLPKLVHLLAGAGGHIEASSKDATESSHGSFSTLDIPRGIGSMPNMQILSHVKVSNNADKDVLINDVVRLQQLRKLGVVIGATGANHLLKVVGMLNDCLCSLSVHINDDDTVELAAMNAEFSLPRSLASLNFSGKIDSLPTWIEQLQQLSKITLCRTLLTDKDIQILGNLVNLHFIRLRHKSYTQSKITFQKGFKKLEVLVIEGSDISDIHFETRAARNLEKIVWNSTRRMETLEVDKLPSLKEVELHGDYDLSSIKRYMDANPNHPKLK